MSVTLSWLQNIASKDFSGNWFQPFTLDEKITLWGKIYKFWIPFSYLYENNSRNRKVINFVLTQSALKIIPDLAILGTVRRIYQWLDVFVELNKKYKKMKIVQNIILPNAKKLLDEWYLVETKSNVSTWDSNIFDTLYWADSDFDSIKSWKKTITFNRRKDTADVSIIDKEKIDSLRKDSKLENADLQTPSEIRDTLTSFWFQNLKETVSSQSKSYYLKILSTYTLEKSKKGEDLTQAEKDKIVSNVNNFYDTLMKALTK